MDVLPLIVLFAATFLPLRAQLNFMRTKDLKIERSEPCPNAEGNAIQMYNYSNVHRSRTIIVMNADIHILRDITGPLTFQMQVKRCNLDLSKCDAYDTFKVTDVCDKLQQTGAMWSQYSTKVQPPLRCPIKQGIYKLTDGQADYSLTSRLPIDGNRWVTYMKIFEEYTAPRNATKGAKAMGKRKQVWCLDSDVRITLSKAPARPTRAKHPPRATVPSTSTTNM